MKNLYPFFTLLFLPCLLSAQPFRYIAKGSKAQKDSIRDFKIKGYREYVSMTGSWDTTRFLNTIMEYDKNGNNTRQWVMDKPTGRSAQWTYKFDEQGRLLEHISFFPDSLTRNQRFVHEFDKKGNEIVSITESYDKGKLIGTKKTLYDYDSKGHCIEIKDYNYEGKLNNHYTYKYDEAGNKTEETTHYGDKSYTRKVDRYEDREEAYGLPMGRGHSEYKRQEVKTVLHEDGGYTQTDEFGSRTFTKKGILLHRTEGNFKTHWFVYTFYP